MSSEPNNLPESLTLDEAFRAAFTWFFSTWNWRTNRTSHSTYWPSTYGPILPDGTIGKLQSLVPFRTKELLIRITRVDGNNDLNGQRSILRLTSEPLFNSPVGECVGRPSDTNVMSQYFWDN
jgi:hypothetical protein